MPTPQTETIEFVSQDNLPDSGYVLMNVEQADPALDRAAALGIGIIAGTPTISFEGKDLVNKLIPVGVRSDGSPLELDPTVVVYNPAFEIQNELNPDGTTYWFLADQASVDTYGEFALRLVRSDIKSGNTDPSIIRSAQRALYAIAAGELLKRRSEILSFGCLIANGHQVWARVGDAIRVRYRGLARRLDGRMTPVNIDQFMVIMSRTESGGAAGVTQVAFDLAAPTITYDVPGVIAIPTPKTKSTTPTNKTKQPDSKGNYPGASDPPYSSPSALDHSSTPDFTMPTGVTDLADSLKGLTEGIGSYAPCCADPTTDVAGGAALPPGANGIPGGIAASVAQVVNAGTNDPPEGVTVTGFGDDPKRRVFFLLTADYDDPGPSGGNLTWTQIDSQSPGGGLELRLYMALIPPATSVDDFTLTKSTTAGNWVWAAGYTVTIGTLNTTMHLKWGMDASDGTLISFGVIDEGGTYVFTINDAGTLYPVDVIPA